MAKQRFSVVFIFVLICNFSQAVEVDEDSLGYILDNVIRLENSNAELRSDMVKLKQEYGKTVAELNDRIATLETDNAETANAEIPISCEDNKPNSKRLVLSNNGVVAFSAAIAPVTVPHLSLGETIVFETIITNIGGAYSKDDGVFVSPINGLYMFSCSVLDDEFSRNKLHAEITVNNSPVARIFAYAEHGVHRDQGAQTVFVQLGQGDHVRVRHIDEDDGTIGGELYTTFSGYLLWATE